jgi:hypothetical protein
MTTRVRARLLLAVLMHLAVLCHGAAGQVFQRSPIRVRLTVAAGDPISGVVWNSMTEECSRIWSREGVELLWPGTDDGAPPHVTLPLLFNHRELHTHDPADKEALGVTVFSGRSQHILVSLARARRMIANRRGLADSSDAMSLDIAHGRVLARVVAHEIGHALLLTLTHATHGLMSPQIEARGTPPIDDGQFTLTLVERERLNTRFSLLATSPQRADAAAPVLRARVAANREGAATPITWTVVPVPSRPLARR